MGLSQSCGLYHCGREHGPCACLLAADGDGKKPDAKTIAQGRTLFEREWQPGDSRSHGGDGLGPVYNDSSCVACHNSGGTGGAGSNGKNVDIITATPNRQASVVQETVQHPVLDSVVKALRSLVGIDKPAPAQAPAPAAAPAKPARPKVDTTALVKAHPGFRTARSIVLHQFGTEDKYEQWRQTFVGVPVPPPLQSTTANASMIAVQMTALFNDQPIQNQIGPFTLTRSQRNPTALFGAGLIDSIPESEIEAAARAEHPGFPQIAGRVSRLKDKRIGRFGWKAQTASLSDFVLTACAVELGLEVPAHHQAGSPQHPDALPKGLDLNTQECDSLIAYVANLPRPVQRKPETDREAAEVRSGQALFAKTGCASCHVARLGKVDGIYSDLLLHDLGPGLGDVGQYGVFDPSSSEDEVVDDPNSVADASTPSAGMLPIEVPPEVVPAAASRKTIAVRRRTRSGSCTSRGTCPGDGCGDGTGDVDSSCADGYRCRRPGPLPDEPGGGSNRAATQERPGLAVSNGARRPCGASATQRLTCTTAAPRRWTRRLPSTAARRPGSRTPTSG